MEINNFKKNLQEIDSNLSKRNINLDPKGYFIIKLNLEGKQIIVEHYLNKIDEDGLALDPITNEPIKCKNNKEKNLHKIFSGKTAKEVGVSITENNHNLISKFDHALYLGRELQKAEDCLINNIPYIQD